LSDNIDMLETDYKREQEPHQDADGDVFLWEDSSTSNVPMDTSPSNS
jgi:hypothetical protein